MSAHGGDYPAQTCALRIVKSEAPVNPKKTLVIVEVEGPAERVDRYVAIVLDQIKAMQNTMKRIAQVKRDPEPCPTMNLYAETNPFAGTRENCLEAIAARSPEAYRRLQPLLPFLRDIHVQVLFLGVIAAAAPDEIWQSDEIMGLMEIARQGR